MEPTDQPFVDTYAKEFLDELARLHVDWMIKGKNRRRIEDLSVEELHQNLSLPYALRQETKGIPAIELAHFYIAYQLKLFRRLVLLGLPLFFLFGLGF